MGTNEPSTEKPLDILRARAFLMIGGLMGWHRLYLRQIPEAFIFFSTWGVFLLGIFYDSFFLHSFVQEHNDKLEGNSDGRPRTVKFLLPTATSEHVPFSLTKFVYSVLYGMYLGGFVCFTGNITLGWTPADNFPLMIIVAGAVAFGIFLVGNSAGESRKASLIWLATFTTIAIALKAFNISSFRAIFFGAIAGTLVGNRGAKKLPARDRSFSYKHYVFWCSLWLFCICLCVAGSCRQLLEKRVTFHSTEARVTSTLAKLLYDSVPLVHSRSNILCGSILTETDLEQRQALWNRTLLVWGNDWYLVLNVWSICLHADKDWETYQNPERVYRFFDLPSLQIIFEKNPAPKRKQQDSWMDGVVTPAWTEHAFAFTLDLFKAEARTRKVIFWIFGWINVSGKLIYEPLKWAAWRLYLRWVFELSASARDDQYEAVCASWIRQQHTERRGSTSRGFQPKQVLSIRRACEIANS